MEWDLDRDLERLRDLEADFVDLDITAASPPQTVTQKEWKIPVRSVKNVQKNRRIT